MQSTAILQSLIDRGDPLPRGEFVLDAPLRWAAQRIVGHGTTLTPAPGVATAIQGDAVNAGRVEGLTLKGFDAAAIVLARSVRATVAGCTFQGCGLAVRCDPGPGADAHTMLTAEGNSVAFGGAGFLIEHGQAVTLARNDFEGLSGVPVEVRGCIGLTLDGNWFEQVAAACLLKFRVGPSGETGVRCVRVAGNQFRLADAQAEVLDTDSNAGPLLWEHNGGSLLGRPLSRQPWACSPRRGNYFGPGCPSNADKSER